VNSPEPEAQETGVRPAPFEVQLLSLVGSGQVKLPPYPAVAKRLRDLCSGDEFELADVARIASADQVLSAAVLRAARSPVFRARTEVGSLDEAVARVGVDVVVELAFAVGLGGHARGGVLESLRRGSWRRGLFAAEIARALAPVYRVDSSEAYTAGLLHDFGEILAYAALDEIAAARRISISRKRCREIAEEHHVELGVLLAERWNLPEPVIAAIEGHGNASDRRPIVELVRTVDGIVSRIERGLPAVLAIGELAFPATARVLLEELLPELPAIVRDFEPTGRAKEISSTVLEREETTLENKRPAKFTATIQGKRHRGTQIANDGFELNTTSLLAEQTICEVELDGPGGAFPVFAVVSLVEKGNPTHRVELMPCALDRVSDERWRRLKGAFAPPLPRR
jgi:putative nucleotidyltransferase with HDIG domain